MNTGQHSRQTHLLRPLQKGGKVYPAYALLSTHPETARVVIFLHGFMGDAVETWIDFFGQIDQWRNDDWREKSDLFFFQYRSVMRSTAVTADDVLKWIKRIYPQPNADWFKADTKGLPKELCNANYDVHVRATSRYTELILVGHSEGGLVLRRAMLNDIKEENNGRALKDAKVRLFAPALFGVMPTGVFGVLLQAGSLGMLARMWLHWGAAYQEMKTDSKILDAIRDDTQYFADKDPSISSLRALILWGENENIVTQGEYRCDIRWDCLPDHDHVSICKPTENFSTPLEFVCQNEMTARSS